MKPVKRNERTAFHNGPKVSVASVKDDDELQDDVIDFVDDAYNEDREMSFIANDYQKEKQISSEEIKIKALKQAIDIAKLMSDVTTDDVLAIAAKVAKFIKG